MEDIGTSCLGAGCKATPRYELPDGRVACAEHYPDLLVGAPPRPTACKVFSATRSRDREQLGEKATEWLRAHDVDVTGTFIAQSSDNAFHCFSIVMFYRERA